ncbi:MAG: hypothetical protein P9X27_00655 [Candidatus Kaelpia aquatica]|nr:hypothetical protein [Candidatus Kaelpia aquatica]
MRKFFKKIHSLIQGAISLVIDLLLFLSYFIVITPFAILIKVFKDYLGLKQPPQWKKENKITDISLFLKKQ